MAEDVKEVSTEELEREIKALKRGRRVERIALLSLCAVLAVCLGLVTVLSFSAYPRGDSDNKLAALEALILERFIGQTDQKAMEDAAANAMVDSLGDRWSYYLTAEAYAAHVETQNNAYVGIGVTVQKKENAGLEIVSLAEGGSAKEAGLLPGDVIVEAGGQSLADLTTAEAQALIRGKAGTTVELKVDRAGESLTFDLERRSLKVAVATGTMLPGNVGLVTIENFDSRCAEESKAAVEDLLAQGAEKLIFDVRNNPGGYVSELVNLLDYLLPEGPLFRSVNYKGEESLESSDANCVEVPMAVLVNGDSYSAAEFFAAALSEYEAAVVVGQPTCGKGYFQQTYPFADGSAVGLSTGKYFTPKGVSLAEAGGLTPDIVVEVDEDAYRAISQGTLAPEEDPQLQAALDALK